MSNTSTNWSIAYTSACERMGSVPWVESQCVKHAQHVAPDGCAFPEDVCISGAAGHRFESAWAFIDRDMRPQAVRILQRYPTPGHEPEDLWAVAVVNLSMETKNYTLNDSELTKADKKPAAIIVYAGKVPLFRYFLTVAKRHAYSQTEKKSPAFFAPDTASISGAENPSSQSPSSQSASSTCSDRVREQLERVMSTWTAEELFLVHSVYVLGKTRKKAAGLLGWDDATKATRWLQRLCSQINEAIDWKDDSDSDPQDSEQLHTIVKEIRRFVQLGNANLSEHVES